ncbi:MAG: MFS transporter [Candidatus Omnitrophica bacterium]|nr:MFS transporter [Candidatus Omnitrophota bacterium]
MFRFIFDKKNEQFMRLWWAQLISQFGDRLNQMALIGLIAQRDGSAYSLAKLLSFTIIPVFIVGPIAGVYVDRWDKRTTLFICDIARGLLVLAIPFLFMQKHSIIEIYIVVFLIFCFSRFYVPAKMSIVPELVPAENILMANSLLTTTGMLAFVMGCALGGFLVDKIGARAGFIGDSATYFISALMILSMRSKFKLDLSKKKIIEKGKEFIAIEKSFFSEIKEGMQYLFSQRQIRFVMNMFFILLSAAGAIYVVIIVFIQKAFNTVTRDLGVLAVCLGAGLFVGALCYGRWGKKVLWSRTIFLSLIAGGAMIIVFAVTVQQYPNVILAGGLAFLLGVVISPIFIASNTIVHVASDEKMRGKVFSSLEIVIHLAFLTSMLISSWLAQRVDPFWILVSVGAIFTVVGIAGIVRYRHGGDLAFLTEKMHS